MFQRASERFQAQFSLSNEPYLPEGLATKVAEILAELQANIDKLEKFRVSFQNALAQHLSAAESHVQDFREKTSGTSDSLTGTSTPAQALGTSIAASTASESSIETSTTSATLTTAPTLFKACADIIDEPTSKIHIESVETRLIELFDKATVFVPLMPVELYEFDVNQMGKYFQDNVDLLIGRLQSKRGNSWTKGKKFKSYEAFCTKLRAEMDQKIKQLDQAADAEAPIDRNTEIQKYEILKVFLQKLSEFGKKEFAEARKPLRLF